MVFYPVNYNFCFLTEKEGEMKKRVTVKTGKNKRNLFSHELNRIQNSYALPSDVRRARDKEEKRTRHVLMKKFW